jgi:hypothetical protein
MVGHTGRELSGAFSVNGTWLNFKSPALPGYYQEAVPLETPSGTLTFVILKMEASAPDS